MMKKYLNLFLSSTILLLPLGCVSVISKEVRREVARNLSLREVIKDPGGHQGKVVLWGGAIIESKNVKEGTRVTVLQKDLNRWGRPKESDKSQGRFIVLYPGYLDTAIYRSDREITVAGEIIGQKVMPIGDIKYTYPVLSPREIHLWREVGKAQYPYGPYPWWWDYPYWPYPRGHHYPWYPYRPWYRYY
jgi:outer membrane lipoprotein